MTFTEPQRGDPYYTIESDGAGSDRAIEIVPRDAIRLRMALDSEQNAGASVRIGGADDESTRREPAGSCREPPAIAVQIEPSVGLRRSRREET